MQLDFTASMAAASDADIIRIVGMDRDNYQPAAVLAAEQELASRGLSSDYVTEVQAVNAAEQAVMDRKAGEPLDIGWKVVAFLMPVIALFILAAMFKRDGYDRKARELGTWTLYGWGFYIALIIFNVAL